MLTDIDSTGPSRESHSGQHDGDVLATSTAIGLAQLLDDQAIEQGTVAEEGLPS